MSCRARLYQAFDHLAHEDGLRLGLLAAVESAQAAEVLAALSVPHMMIAQGGQVRSVSLPGIVFTGDVVGLAGRVFVGLEPAAGWRVIE